MVRSRWASLPVPHNTINQQYSAHIIIHARERGRKQGEKEKENMANSPAFNEANLVCFGVSKCSSHRQKKRRTREEVRIGKARDYLKVPVLLAVDISGYK